jgi:branched-chain amino acid transport system substrate-binding protein
MNRLLLVLLSVLCTVLLGGCETQKEPIKIGMAINLSGRGGEAGEHIRDGALLAVDEINRQGGIHGRRLQLLVRDDENTDAGIRKAVESLLAENVVAVIGHSYSSSTMKGYPIVTGNGTVMMTAYTATSQLSGKDDLFFRTAVDCVLYGEKTARLLDGHGAKSVAFLMDMTNRAFVEDYAAGVKAHFSGEVTQVSLNSRENTDWNRIMADLLATDPDVVVLLTEASMTGVALQKLTAEGFSGPCVATLWAQSPELLRHSAGETEKLSIITFINPDNTLPAYLAFSRNMEEKFHKKATSRSTRAYEMVTILAEALKQCKTYTAHELKEQLLRGEYQTIMGTVKFDATGDVIRPVYEVVVQDGEFHSRGEI